MPYHKQVDLIAAISIPMRLLELDLVSSIHIAALTCWIDHRNPLERNTQNLRQSGFMLSSVNVDAAHPSLTDVPAVRHADHAKAFTHVLHRLPGQLELELCEVELHFRLIEVLKELFAKQTARESDGWLMSPIPGPREMDECEVLDV